jgi:hypothetical protein
MEAFARAFRHRWWLQQGLTQFPSLTRTVSQILSWDSSFLIVSHDCRNFDWAAVCLFAPYFARTSDRCSSERCFFFSSFVQYGAGDDGLLDVDITITDLNTDPTVVLQNLTTIDSLLFIFIGSR